MSRGQKQYANTDPKQTTQKVHGSWCSNEYLHIPLMSNIFYSIYTLKSVLFISYNWTFKAFTYTYEFDRWRVTYKMPLKATSTSLYELWAHRVVSIGPRFTHIRINKITDWTLLKTVIFFLINRENIKN